MVGIILRPVKAFFVKAGKIPIWCYLALCAVILGCYGWRMLIDFYSYFE